MNTHSSAVVSQWASMVAVRECVPARAQALPPKSQLDHGGTSAWQSASLVQCTQAWRASSHRVEPAHGLPAPGWHAPSAQVSKPLQNTPSSQRSALARWAQPVPVHRSSVHPLPSAQSGGSQIGPASMSASMLPSALASGSGGPASTLVP